MFICWVFCNIYCFRDEIRVKIKLCYYWFKNICVTFINNINWDLFSTVDPAITNSYNHCYTHIVFFGHGKYITIIKVSSNLALLFFKTFYGCKLIAIHCGIFVARLICRNTHLFVYIIFCFFRFPVQKLHYPIYHRIIIFFRNQILTGTSTFLDMVIQAEIYFAIMNNFLI